MGSLAGAAGVNDVNSMPRVSFGSCMLDGDGLGRGEGGRLPLGDACAAAAAVAVASFSSRLPEKDSMKSFMESTGLDHPVLKPAMLGLQERAAPGSRGEIDGGDVGNRE